MEDFDLDDNKSSCFISFWSFKDSVKSVENAEIEGGYFAVFNKVEKTIETVIQQIGFAVIRYRYH